MTWVIFVAGAVLSWGVYGAMLHQGQVALGNPLKALLCVGVAYFLIGVLVPVAALGSQGGLSNFDPAGTWSATIAAPAEARTNPTKSMGLIADFGGWMAMLTSTLTMGAPPKTSGIT